MKKKPADKKKKGRIKKALLAIAIALILVFFVGYGVYTFYKDPKWEDYCPVNRPVAFDTKETCGAAGGNWTVMPVEKLQPVLSPEQYLCTQSPSVKGGTILFNCITYEQQNAEQGWCDPDYTCRKSYESVIEPHNRISFIILAIIGIMIISLATLVIKENIIGYGTLAGGILTVLYGTIRYWGAIPDKARLAILGIVLAVLIWIAYKRFIKD